MLQSLVEGADPRTNTPSWTMQGAARRSPTCHPRMPQLRRSYSAVCSPSRASLPCRSAQCQPMASPLTPKTTDCTVQAGAAEPVSRCSGAARWLQAHYRAARRQATRTSGIWHWWRPHCLPQLPAAAPVAAPRCHKACPLHPHNPLLFAGQRGVVLGQAAQEDSQPACDAIISRMRLSHAGTQALDTTAARSAGAGAPRTPRPNPPLVALGRGRRVAVKALLRNPLQPILLPAGTHTFRGSEN